MSNEYRRRLEESAVEAGLSLSDYLQKGSGTETSRPPLEEWLDRVAQREPVQLSVSPAQAVREERDRR